MQPNGQNGLLDGEIFAQKVFFYQIYVIIVKIICGRVHRRDPSGGSYLCGGYKMFPNESDQRVAVGRSRPCARRRRDRMVEEIIDYRKEEEASDERAECSPKNRVLAADLWDGHRRECIVHSKGGGSNVSGGDLHIGDGGPWQNVPGKGILLRQLFGGDFGLSAADFLR
jgi:hypothetical protein